MCLASLEHVCMLGTTPITQKDAHCSVTTIQISLIGCLTVQSARMSFMTLLTKLVVNTIC